MLKFKLKHEFILGNKHAAISMEIKFYDDRFEIKENAEMSLQYRSISFFLN
jgi:hypothetical protein